MADSLSLEEENLVSAIDALQDELIKPFLMTKFKHPVDRINGYFRRSDDRVSEVMDYLTAAVEKGAFQRWDYPAISLFCMLDWGFFRRVLKKEEEVPGAQLEFYDRCMGQDLVRETSPWTQTV